MRKASGTFWGRADDTLKIAGKRVGPAEIESVLVEHPAVVEAGVIGVPDERRVRRRWRSWCYAPARSSANRWRRCCATLCGADGQALMPKAVYAVPELPKTRNAKIMRRVIRAAYLGEPTGDLSALENPHSVEAIRALATR